jgi:hypothetical protein
MQIDEAIRCLIQAKERGSQNVILAFWEQDMFALPDDVDWADVCDWADDDFDWSLTHESLEILIESKRCEHGV